MKALARVAALALVAATAGVVAPAAVTPAAADPIGSCTTTTGSIVAVDFAHWGGPVVRGCGVGQPSGYALLHGAGFSTAGDNHDGPGYICRIGNRAFAAGTQYPTPAQDPCIVTPPSTAYWSYWLAPAGQNTWTYSSAGAMGHVPQAGEVELWMFGGTDLGGTAGSGVPSFGPDSVRAHNTSPAGNPAAGTPTTRSAPPVTIARENPPTSVAFGGGPAATAPTSGTGPGPDASRGVTSGTGTTDPGRAGPTTTRPGGSKVASVSARRAGAGSVRASESTVPKLVDALPAVTGHPSTGSIAPLLIGLGLAAVLAAGAGVTLWRRRQPE